MNQGLTSLGGHLSDRTDESVPEALRKQLGSQQALAGGQLTKPEMGQKTGDGAVKEDSKRNSGERGHRDRMPSEGSRCCVEGRGQQIRALLL